MAVCRYCRGDVADDAVKCQHCGEWVRAGDARRARGDLHPAIKAVAVAAMVWLLWVLVLGPMFS